MYTQEQVQKYLARIHYQGSVQPTLENLHILHRQHLLNIPYENLDILNNVPLSLKQDDLFRKMIENHRGGYCFELQGLFYYLLQTLGYNVRQFAGRFMDQPGITQMRRHRILVVSFGEKRYVCDVGVRSESPRQPLELATDLVQSDGIGQYRYEKDSFYGWVLMRKLPRKEWRHVLGFTEEPQIDDDYIMLSFFCEKHPDSTFNKYMKISTFTKDANLNIIGNEYRVFQDGKIVSRQELHNDDEAREVLIDKFGINVPKNYGHFIWNGMKK